MAEENEIKETQTQETQNTQGTPETLEAIKAQLEEEKAAKAQAEAAITEKDAKIAELEGSLSEAKQATEASAAELATVKVDRDAAVGKYLSMAKALNPAIPETIISGGTISEIDASIEKGKGIVETVKAAMAAEVKETKVPAGAPTREAISTEGLSAREKIAAGISPQSRETGG